MQFLLNIINKTLRLPIWIIAVVIIAGGFYFIHVQVQTHSLEAKITKLHQQNDQLTQNNETLKSSLNEQNEAVQKAHKQYKKQAQQLKNRLNKANQQLKTQSKLEYEGGKSCPEAMEWLRKQSKHLY